MIQTEVTGSTIDFHLKMLADQVADQTSLPEKQRELDELRRSIAAINEEVRSAEQDGQFIIERIAQVQSDLKSVKTSLETEPTRQDMETRMKDQMQRDIAALKLEIRSKQTLLDEQTEKLNEASAKAEELQTVRDSLERDLADLRQREKPEVQSLCGEVEEYQIRVRESQHKLQLAEEKIARKRELLQSVKSSEEMERYKRLSVEKMKLERRLSKWKMLLKDSRETLQSLEAFSATNFQKRQALADNLERLQRQKTEEESGVRELEQYSILLTALIDEQREHWR
jgi:chromosome segregation ATPase